MFGQNLRFAWRSLISNPGFAASAILALAVGIGLNTAMFSVVDGILIKPLTFREPDQLFVLREMVLRNSGPSPFPLTPGNFLDYRRTAQSADLVCYSLNPFALTAPDSAPERYAGVTVSEGWFRFYGAKIIAGRDFTSEDHTPGRDTGVIISEGLWRDRFAAAPDIAGRQVFLNGTPRQIVGVVEGRFDYPVKNRIWAPLAMDEKESSRRDFHRLLTQGRLRPGYTISQARAEFSSLLANLAQQFPQSNSKKSIYLEPMAEDMTGKIKPALQALIGAVMFVLAIACANVANLILARSSVRRGELAVRAALGASRGALMGQLLTESMLLSALGGLLGLVLAVGAFFAFKYFAPVNLPRIDEVSIDGRVILYNLAAVVLTGLIFGVAPALRMSRVDLNGTLKERTRGGSTRTYMRNLLVVGQVAIALMLMTGAGLLIRSLYNLTQVDLGFNPANLVSMNVTPLPAKYDDKTPQQVQFGQAILKSLEHVSGIRSAALTSGLPFLGNQPRYLIYVEGAPLATPATAPVIDYAAVSPAYFETMQIPLIAGRTFTDRDDFNAPPVVVVNEAFVKAHFSDGRAVGRRLDIGLGNPPEWREIVGVVKDVKTLNLDQVVRPQVYSPYFYDPSIVQSKASTFSVVVRTEGDPVTLAGTVRQKILEADNAQPVWQVQTVTKAINDSLARERFTLFLMGVFALVAFVLAIIGLSGVMAYTVSQRTREIGIRLAIGAQPVEVLWMVLKHSLLLVAAGIVGGVVGSAIVTSSLRNLLYKTSPFDPLTFGGIALVFLMTAAISGLIPARRAAQIDPAITLRS
jgi:predicted permease